MLSLEVGVRTFMPHPSGGPKKAKFLCKRKTAVSSVELAAADPPGSVGLVAVGFLSVKSPGTVLGQFLGPPAMIRVSNPHVRRARLEVLILLWTQGSARERE
jgi:hypothetical protein